MKLFELKQPGRRGQPCRTESGKWLHVHACTDLVLEEATGRYKVQQ